VSLAKPTERVWKLDDGYDALYPMGQKRCFLEDFDEVAKVKKNKDKNRLFGRDHREGTPSRCRGSEKRGLQALGRSRGGFGSKIHLIADGKKRVLAIRISAGQDSDYSKARELIKEAAKFKPKALAADKGYDGDSVRRLLRRNHIIPCIPGRINRKRKMRYDADSYKLRKKIEHHFAHLKEFRGIATRYAKTATHFLNHVILALTTLFLKTIC